MLFDKHSVFRLARISTILCAGFLCLAFIALASAPSYAKTIHVPGDSATIQDAVNRAAKGDTITVNSGTYVENVVIDKAITVIGQDTGNGMPTVDGQGKDGIKITVGSVTLQGFKVINSYNGIKVDPSIQNSVSKINLIDNVLTGNSYGINGRGYVNVVGNNASNNKVEGIYLMVYDSNVTGNTANGNVERGFYLDCSGLSVTGNTANDNGDIGIYLKSDNNVVTGNVACHNHLGISVLEGSKNVLRGNMASNNDWAGIYLLTDSYGNEITGNTADNNRYVGICFNHKNVSANTVTGNWAYNNSKGGLAVFEYYNFSIITYETPEETFNHQFSYDFSS